MADDPSSELRHLADLYGVQTSYRDVFGRVQSASGTALLATLRALGAPVEDLDDVSDAIRLRRRELWGRLLEPVSVSFDRSSIPVALRLPRRHAGQHVTFHLTLEDGGPQTWTEDLQGLAMTEQADVDGVPHVGLQVTVRDLPYGYHRLAVELQGSRGETFLIVAPPRAYPPQDRRAWGSFLPLHAVRTQRDWGAGDLSDLAGLANWIGERGGAIVGTLPLLPVYLGGKAGGTNSWGAPPHPRDGAGAPAEGRRAGGSYSDPSPYSPLSRLFWNELVLDLTRAPELSRCDPARELMSSSQVAEAVSDLRQLRHVDYERIAEVKGRVLAALARCFFEEPGARGEELSQFLSERPEVADYARFRGAVARYGPAWWEWPEELARRPATHGGGGVTEQSLRATGNGATASSLSFDDVDRDEARAHLYAQLLAREQIAGLAVGLRRTGLRPYLDLPVGARGDGYDVWRHRDVFVREAVSGAPPDAIFTGGQNWGLPPLHPGRLREHGYDYLVAVLRHHLRLADLLRIDHVMGLHRLYWIPEGMDARDGVYVRYPAQEWYAILTLESHRHRSCIAGENLGTVPPEVQEALAERGILRMYVVQYETDPDGEDILRPVPGDVVASVNTHDMPPFGAWWEARDVDDGLDLGLLDHSEAEEARVKRSTVRRRIVDLLVAGGHITVEQSHDPAAVHAGLLAWLGASAAPVVLVNLEDLWLEQQPQNTPGTRHERPNWRRRAALTLEEFADRPEVVEPLHRLDATRRGTEMGKAKHEQ
ncbi:MAG: 4-alpha-glucanotransferase [Nitriliruptorales bacterium]